MKIVRMKTGASCVTLLEEELIFVDPDLDNPKDMVHAIREAMPDTHPDAIGHWVEEVMPTTTPLIALRADRRRARRAGLHRTARTVGRTGKHLTTAVATAALTVIAIPLVQGAGPAPVATADAWENDVFSKVQTGSSWDCLGTDSSDLVATCTTPDGTVMHAEAWVGPNSFTFVFTYRDVRTGRQHRNTLKVFSSEGGVQAWLGSSPTDSQLFPNLTAGERWAMYGSDRERLRLWSERLGKDLVLPADISEAAFEMGLLPSPDRRASNVREMESVPEAVRKTAARILVGDETLPIPVNTPAHTGPPAGGVDFPFPATPEPNCPAPSPPTPTTPPGEPSTTDPTTDPLPATDPVPAPDPTTDPLPATDPVPAPDPTTEPLPAPVPVTDPVPAPDPTTEPLPAPLPVPDGAPTSPPTEPTDTAPATEPAPVEAPAPISEPTAPETEPSPAETAEPPAPTPAADEAGSEQGPAQPEGEPAGDELTGPITVPDDAAIPAFDQTVEHQAQEKTPIFDEVASTMALVHSQAPEHAQGLPFAA